MVNLQRETSTPVMSTASLDQVNTSMIIKSQVPSNPLHPTLTTSSTRGWRIMRFFLVFVIMLWQQCSLF